MENEAIKINDLKARIIGIPALSLLMHYGYHPDVWNTLNGRFFTGWLASFMFTFTFWQGNRWIWGKLREWFPQYHQTRTRLIWLFFLCIAFTLVASVVCEYLASLLLDFRCRYEDFRESFLVSLIPTFVCLLVYESVYFFEAWKRNVKKSEELARENIQSQLEVLKNQLDPHFLFNSLNTLASLIDDENQPAQEYLDRLADVYRYVLVSREKNTVTLEEEMNFLDAYIYLNKVRFRENLRVEKAIQAEAYHRQVAPLSLQMLVENAIKHNVVSKEKPLVIRIAQEIDNYLSIENNVQEKVTFEKSTKVGLQNIINRYRLLTDRQVEISKNTEFFSVRLPLLQ
jgi:sensor histidine kinase YesM